MQVASAIRAKLELAFAPHRLTVEDQSHRHAGHAGARPEGETHFLVEIVSERFAGLSRLERQRLVNQVLAEELRGRVHALAMRTLTPDEAAQ